MATTDDLNKLIGSDEYYIEFDTRIYPGELQGIRVRLDAVHVTDLDKILHIDLCNHPLYPKLRAYILANDPMVRSAADPGGSKK